MHSKEKKTYLSLLIIFVVQFMLFGLKQGYLVTFSIFFLFLPMFVFLVAVHITDNDRSQLLLREV